MPKGKNLVKIHGAAVYFAHVSRDIQEIATTFDVSERSVRRWAEEEQGWEESLNACGYTGDPAFFKPKPTRKPDRDTEDLFKATYDAYIKARKEGKPLHKLPTIIAHNIGAGLSARRVYEWAKKYGWQDIMGDKERIKIHGAAFYFVHVSRDIEKLVKFLKVSEDLLQQWTKNAEWNKSLEVYEYEGVRTFFKTVKRTSNTSDFPTEIDFSDTTPKTPFAKKAASRGSQNPSKPVKEKKGNTFR